MGNVKYDSLAVAIRKVLKEEGIEDRVKIERIEGYVQVYFDNKEDHLEDVL